jgi:hypothetical protein
MADMNAEMYRCCGYTVEISGYQVELPGDVKGRLVYCESCGGGFVTPGDIENARTAVSHHFLSKHGLTGQLEDWRP